MKVSRLAIFGLAASSALLASPVDPFKGSPRELEDPTTTTPAQIHHVPATASTTRTLTSSISVTTTEHPAEATHSPGHCGVGYETLDQCSL